MGPPQFGGGTRENENQTRLSGELAAPQAAPA